MARRRHPHILPLNHLETQNMKVTQTAVYAGPDGVARAGTVLDLPQPEADQRIKDRSARPFDKERDAKKPFGLQKAPSEFGDQ